MSVFSEGFMDNIYLFVFENIHFNLHLHTFLKRFFESYPDHLCNFLRPVMEEQEKTSISFPFKTGHHFRCTTFAQLINWVEICL